MAQKRHTLWHNIIKKDFIFVCGNVAFVIWRLFLPHLVGYIVHCTYIQHTCILTHCSKNIYCHWQYLCACEIEQWLKFIPDRHANANANAFVWMNECTMCALRNLMFLYLISIQILSNFVLENPISNDNANCVNKTTFSPFSSRNDTHSATYTCIYTFVEWILKSAHHYSIVTRCHLT